MSGGSEGKDEKKGSYIAFASIAYEQYNYLF